MHKNVLIYLGVMVSSGIPFDIAIIKLSKEYEFHKGLKQAENLLNKGNDISIVLKKLFPWWCSYPFSDFTESINSVDFIRACNVYIDDRYTTINNLIKLLSYPIFLLCFAVLILLLTYQLINNGPDRSFLLFIVMIAVFFIITFIFFCSIYLSFKKNPYDILFVIYLGLNQGWSYKSIVTLHVFKKYGLSFKSFLIKLCNMRSFIKVFDWYFTLPLAIKDSLLFYESSGWLVQGLDEVLPIYKTYNASKLIKICLVFKCFIYLYVVALILLLFFVLYKPMLIIV